MATRAKQQPSVAKATKPQQPSKTNYLIAYNAISSLLWQGVLFMVLTIIPTMAFGRTYPEAGQYTKWTQTIAVMEAVHSAIGIVRAPLGTTSMQVASRLLLVWLIVNPFPYLAESPAYTSMLLAWSLSEVIRYSYFVGSLTGYLPKALTWLRYSAFYVLYPVGIASECWMIYLAIDPVGKAQFGAVGVWALIGVLGTYIPGSYVLFSHMMGQRKKVMRSLKDDKKQ